MQVQPPKPPPFGCNAPCQSRAWLNNHLLFLLSFSLSPAHCLALILAFALALSFSLWLYGSATHTTIDRRKGHAEGNPRLGCHSARRSCLVFGLCWRDSSRVPASQFVCAAERGWKSIASRSDFSSKYASGGNVLFRVDPSAFLSHPKKAGKYCLCVCNSLSSYCLRYCGQAPLEKPSEKIGALCCLNHCKCQMQTKTQPLRHDVFLRPPE